MSISSAMLAGISGLTANSASLASISNNIANVNTVGYKRQDTEFLDLVTAQSGTKGAYAAGGVQSVTRQLINQQGETRQTSSATDLAIAGQGFFVATTDPTDNSVTSPRNFTRAGSFTPDKAGYLQNAAGLYLQGWLADANGDIQTDPSDVTKLQTINVNGLGGSAGPSTAMSITANLNAGQAVSAAAGDPNSTPPGAGSTYDAASTTASMANYDPAAGTGTKPDFTIPLTVVDSQGGRHGVEMRLLKSATANQWNYELVSSDGALISGAPLHDGQVASGVLAFTSTGQLDPANTTGFPDPNAPTLTIGGSDTTPAAGGASWKPTLGIAGQSIALSLGKAPGGVTQFASNTIVTATTDNGVVFGNLSSVDIDQEGFVTAKYDNGVVRKVAQVAIATFPNPDGLHAISGDAWQVSLASGSYNLKEPGTGGAGAISPSSLENSTVDLSTEFTGLITTQRAYLGFLQDYHHGRSDAAGVDRHQALMIWANTCAGKLC